MAKSKQVALVAAYDASGKLLLGKRRDNGKWTLPGGGIEPGEDPKAAATRELHEETGLYAKTIEPKNTQHLTNGVTIFYFRAEVEGTPTGAKDPDQECEVWEFVDVGDGLPWDKYSNLHGPDAADDNVVKQTYDMAKSETEIDRMLKNPDRRERELAMRLDGVEPRHVAAALMDPDPALVHAAMNHPHSVSPELLMGVCRTPVLSDGTSAQARHRLLLQFYGDRFTLPHLRTLLATHAQPHPHLLEAIMKAPASDDPEFSGDVFNRLEAARPMTKAIDPKVFSGMVKGLSAAGPATVDHTAQLGAHPAAHGHLAEAYHQHVLAHPDPRRPLKGQGELHRGVSKKLIFSAPVGEGGGVGKFMVKPYHENVGRWRRDRAEIFPILGWSEMASQGLFHAAGLGHIHQKVHLVEHQMDESRPKEPALVIHVEPGFKQAAVAPRHWMNPQSDADLHKLVMMDFLTNNMDRNGGNLLVNPEGHLLAIDNGRSFQYTTNPYYFSRGETLAKLKQRPFLSDSFRHYHYGSAAQAMEPFWNTALNTMHEKNMDVMERYKPTFEWWAGAGPFVRAEMEKQLQAIKDPALRSHIRRNFEARADWLDERAEFGIDNYGTDWHSDETLPQYRFGEKSEKEIEADAKAEAVSQGEREDRENRIRDRAKAKGIV